MTAASTSSSAVMSPNITLGQRQGHVAEGMGAVMDGNKNWATLGLSVLIVATMGGNVLVCIAVSWERRLQNMTNYFLMSLAIADLMVGTLVMPLALVVELYGYFPLSEEICVLWASLDVLMCTASIWHMCTLSTDRYLTLKYPMKYGRNKTKLMVAIKIAFVWLVSIAISSPIVVMGFLDFSTVYVDGRCVPTSKSFIIYGSILAYFVPLLINIVTYALTMRILFHNQKMLLGHLSGAGSGHLPRVYRLHGGGGKATNNHPRDLHLRSIDGQSLPSVPCRLWPVANGNITGAVAVQRSRQLTSASDEYSDTFTTSGADVTVAHLRYRNTCSVMGRLVSSSLKEELNDNIVDKRITMAVSEKAKIQLTTLVAQQSSDEISEDGERTFEDSSDHVNCLIMSQGQLTAGDLQAASRVRDTASQASPGPTAVQQHPIVNTPQQETPIVCVVTASESESSVITAKSDVQLPPPSLMYIDTADNDAYIQHVVHSVIQHENNSAYVHQSVEDDIEDINLMKPINNAMPNICDDGDQLPAVHLVSDTLLQSKPSQFSNCNSHSIGSHTDVSNQQDETEVINGKRNGGPTTHDLVNSVSDEEPAHVSLRRYRSAWKCLQRQLSVRTQRSRNGVTTLGDVNKEQGQPSTDHKTSTSSLADGRTSGQRRGHHINNRQHQRILQSSAAKNERKALKVLGIIFTVFVVFWTPFFALNVVSVICEPCVASLSAPALTAIVWLGYVSSLANPVIYTMFNVHFRHAFRNILTCRYRVRCFSTFDPTTDSAALHLTNWATAGNRSTNHAGSGDNVINV